jgi:hypothetical protein
MPMKYILAEMVEHVGVLQTVKSQVRPHGSSRIGSWRTNVAKHYRLTRVLF